MSFRNHGSVSCLALILSLFLLNGCGIFGEDDSRGKPLEYASEFTGCLNELSPRFDKFLKGTISTKEWDSTFECATGALGEFRKFVRGGLDSGYTLDDIHAFVAQILVTNVSVSKRLTQIAF